MVLVALLRLFELPLVFLMWELAWRDYGLRSALRAFFIYAVLASLIYGPFYFLGPQAIHMTLVLMLSYATGGLTRRMFGAGKKYSFRLPTLTS